MSNLVGEKRAEAIRRYEAGGALNEIARALRVRGTRVRSTLVDAGVSIRPGVYRRMFSPAEEEAIAQRYADGEGAGAIAASLGCAQWTVLAIVRRAGGTVRGPGGQFRVFSPEDVSEMARLWHEGESQHAIAQRYGVAQKVVSRELIRNGVTPTPRAARMRKHPFWRGGRVKVSGYTYVLVPPDSPFFSMRNSGGYAGEHRLVMAEHLGRPLRRDETVHHINGNKTDNRLENLQLRQKNHGTGTVYRCRCCGSTDVEAVLISTVIG